MKTSLQNKISIFFIFAVFVSSCASIKNTQTPPVTKKTSPAISIPTSTPKTYSTRTPVPRPTLSSSEATFSAQFAYSKAKTAATRTAAYVTLVSRNAACEDGYDFGFFAEDVLSELNYYSTNDGESWTVVICVPEKLPRIKGYTKIVNSDGSKVWKIYYESLPPDGYEFIKGYEIDPVNNLLYLVPGHFMSGDGWCPSCLFGHGSALYRLDLSSGKVTPVLLPDYYYVDMSISPDMHYLAYSNTYDSNIVYIKDLLGDDDKKIELDKIYVLNGGFTWTPDSKKLIFAAGVNGWEDEKAGISLFQISLNTMKLKNLLFNDKRNLVPWFNSVTNEVWLDDNILNLISINVNERNASSNEWSINIVTGEVIRSSIPTSTPSP